MGKGSQSQAGQGSVGAGSPSISKGTPPTTQKRKNRSSSGNISASAVGKQGPSIGGSGLIRFGFSDDSPGLKVGPVAVLVIALGYLLSVIVLHLLGKLRS